MVTRFAEVGLSTNGSPRDDSRNTQTETTTKIRRILQTVIFKRTFISTLRALNSFLLLLCSASLQLGRRALSMRIRLRCTCAGNFYRVSYLVLAYVTSERSWTVFTPVGFTASTLLLLEQIQIVLHLELEFQELNVLIIYRY